jgi:hypothetical protein
MQSLKVKSVNVLRSMYFAKFYLHLRYRIVTGEGGMGNAKKMCKLQKKVMRLISNIGRVTSCREVFKTLNIGRFKQNSLRHHYNTHQRSDLQSQIFRLDVKKKS